MAAVPVPRSYEECFGDIADAFLSKTGLKNLKAAGSLVSFMEADAQSQTRGSQDLFSLMRGLNDIEEATGEVLIRLGIKEGAPRLEERRATTTLDVTDTTFQKLASIVSAGAPAPIAGATALKVADASLFPGTGAVYVGRGTNRYEGPIAYSSVVNSGSFWTVALSTPTLRFHNHGESVIVALGGDRAVPAGSVMATAGGDPASAVQFKTTKAAKILDGEVLVTGVPVVALKGGVGGNVAKGAVNTWTNAPFSVIVSNPSAVTNGRNREREDEHRNRIRAKRASRQGGTRLALITAATGVEAPDEPKRSVSASIVPEGGGAFALYVDDGTGYEELDEGVAVEPLEDDAVGGENSFALSRFPVARPQTTGRDAAPYALFAGARLAFEVEGEVTEHAFAASDARAIASAAAHDAASSVNADPNLSWSLRTVNGGTSVVAFPRSRDASYIRSVPASENDVAEVFGFPATAAHDVLLYRDDLPLNEFGRTARVTSRPFGDWAGISGDQTLTIEVDGVSLAFDGAQFPRFVAADFAGTGFSSVGPNSPAAWATVFSRRIPGVGASVQSGLLVLESNRGASPDASLRIAGGTLASGGMFSAMTDAVTGAGSDFSLDRNTGEVHLTESLAPGESLSAGSLLTRAFLRGSDLTTVDLGSDGHLWFSVDAACSSVPSGVTATTALDVTDAAVSTRHRARVTSAAAQPLFASVMAGDLVVFWDPALTALGLSGSFRVSRVDAAFTWFEVISATAATPASGVLATAAGLSFARAARPLSEATVSAGVGYTATSLAAVLAVSGATFATRRTVQLTATTDTRALSGGIALAAADAAGQLAGLPRAAAANLVGHVASIESAGTEAGPPDFHAAFFQSLSGSDPVFRRSTGAALDALFGGPVVGLRSIWESTAISEWGNEDGFSTFVKHQVGAPSATAGGFDYTVAQRRGPEVAWVPTADRVAFCRAFQLSWEDQLAVLVDEDAATKRFVLPAARRLRPTTGTYGVTNFFTDLDNAGGHLGTAFGSANDYDDWPAYMPARAISDSADATRSVLWRWFRPGPDGEAARIAYDLPTAPARPVSVVLNDVVDGASLDVTVTLAGGAAATGVSARSTTRLGGLLGAPASFVAGATLVFHLAVATAQRAGGVTTLTLTLPALAVDHGLLVTNVIHFQSTDVNFPSGNFAITGRAPTTISYADPGPNVGPDAAPGTVSFDTGGEVGFSGASPAVAAGQFLRVSDPAAPSIIDFLDHTWRLTAASAGGANVDFKLMGYGGAAVSTISWFPINAADAVTFFANPAQTTAQVAAAVNALTATDGGGLVPVGATVTGTGTGLGLQDRSSAERAAAFPTWFGFADGLNYVDATTPATSPSDYQLSFKLSPSAGLATGADWANETVYLVPRSAKNLADWASAPAFSGLFTAAEIRRSSGARRLQLSSLTSGSVGAVRCQGGTANETSFPLEGGRIGSGGLPTFRALSATAAGAHGGHLALFENDRPSPKASFDAATNVTSITVAGGVASVVLNAGGTPAWTVPFAAGPTSNSVLLIERAAESDFVTLTDTGLGAALDLPDSAEGCWVRLSVPAAPALGASSRILPQNAGFFRVVRLDTGAVGTSLWIENAGFTAQGMAECDVVFLTADSLLPGDKVLVGSAMLGAANQGEWTVTSVGDGGSGDYGDGFHFKLDASGRAAVNFTGPLVLGANAPFFQAYDVAPTRAFKHLISICPAPDDPAAVDLKIDSSNLWERFGAAWGTVVTVLNKVGFPLSAAYGLDGYRRQAGLLGEVGRIVYGDPADPATYPGVATAGAKVDLLGPLVRRIRVSIQARLREGASRADVAAAARQAVARVINDGPHGVPISIAEYLAAAERVNGMAAVAAVDPPLVAGGRGDRISLQPNEKGLVLDPDLDVTVVFAGD